MIDQACTHCTAPVRDAVICPRCVRVTAANLADFGGHEAELITVMIKQVQYAERSDGGKSTDPALAWAGIGDQFLDSLEKYIEANPIALPYAKAAASCLRDLKSTLVSWTRLLAEERNIDYPADTVPALADHLRRNMRILAGHEAAGELVAEVTNLVKRIFVVIDAPANRARFDVGPCPEQLATGEACPGQITALVPADESIRPTLSCSFCKQQWFSEQWHNVGDRILRKKGLAA